jgi:hypothetical protein
MSAILEIPSVTSRPGDFDGQLERARKRLQDRGYEALAVTDSHGLALASRMGDIAIKPCQDMSEVLRASSRSAEGGRRVASVIPMQIMGEDECLPFRNEGSLSATDAIRQSRSEPIARVDMPLDEGGSVAITIVSSYNGEII